MVVRGYGRKSLVLFGAFVVFIKKSGKDILYPMEVEAT